MIQRTLTRISLSLSSLALIMAVFSLVPSHSYAFIYQDRASNYDYNQSYNTNLYVSCYPINANVNIGSPVQWQSSVNGGNGSYYITWFGSEGLSGNGSSVTKSYSYTGSKNANVTVTSGGQTVSRTCDGNVTVYDYNYNPNGYSPVYYSNPAYYSPLTVSCSSNTTFSPVGSYITWTAYPSGGYNNSYYSNSNYGYTYSWSGTDNISGSLSSISAYYSNPGLKYAYVTVYSNGQAVSAQCSNAVTIGSSLTNYYNYNTQYPSATQYPSTLGSTGLQVACAADKINARVDVPVTWNAEAIGSGYSSGFTYAWTGTDGLSGSQSSAITVYTTPGIKSAIITVTSPNGQSQSKACMNTVSIKSLATATNDTTVSTGTNVPNVNKSAPLPATAMSAAALLSLQNIPWGWIAVLVILILMGMVFYLLFNKKKL